MAPKRKPNPNQKVARVHAATMSEMKMAADARSLSVAQLIDEMWKLYKGLNNIMDRSGSANAKISNPS